MIEVELPDGTVAEFPESMSSADIESVLARQFSDQSTPQAVTQAAPQLTGPSFQETDDFLEEQPQAVNPVAADPVPQVVNQPQQKNKQTIASEYGLNLFREGLQGLTFFGSDEIGAALAAGLATLTHDADFKTAYQDIVGAVQSEQNQFRKENPVASTVAQVGGGIASGGATFGKMAQATQGAKAIPRILSNIGLGVAEGSVAGFSAGDTLQERKSGAVGGGALGGLAGGVGGEIANTIGRRVAKSKKVTQLLKQGSDDADTAKFKLNARGKAVKNPAAIEAVKQGYDESVVSMINQSSRQDRSNMRRMLELQNRAMKNAREGATNRPSDVIGDSILQRLKHVKKVNMQSGRELDKVAKSLKGKPADFTKEVDQFVDELADSLEVQIVRGADGVIKPDFSSSIIRHNSAGKRLIRNIVDEMQIDKPIDAFQAHRLKKIIDDQIDFGKTSPGSSGKTERVIKGLRKNLNDALRNQFPEYKKTNEAFSETIDALNHLQETAGKKIDPFGRQGDKALGTLSNSLLSNIRSRVNLANSLDELSDVANKYGGQFNDDLIVQTKFFDELDSVFGPSAARSLAGETAKGGKKAIRAAMGSKTEAAVEIIGSGVDRARGINKENAIKAMRELLKDVPEKGLITR